MLSRNTPILFFILLIVFINRTSAQNNADTYHAIDKTEWEKAVEGLDYTEKVPEQQDADPQNPSSSPSPFAASGLIRVLLFVVIIALLVFIILKVFGKDIFSKNRKVNKGNTISVEDLEERPMESDLDRFLREALEKKDYRLAIRIYYLMVLRNLHESEIIKWKKDKTNRDYLFETSDKQFHPQFSNNTLIYEYIWYGEQAVEEKNFLSVKQSFTNLITAINSSSA
ncbi:MAG: hypothetical protein H7Y00_12220 [Fimbriimonadaceae bacterium]|nr:hypothetical protein [Chitinophagales bacterium]